MLLKEGPARMRGFLCGLFLACYFFVEFAEILSVFLGELNCCARVLIQDTCEEILKVIAPFDTFFFHRVHVFLDEFNDREELVFRVFEETKKKLHCAVSGTTTH